MDKHFDSSGDTRGSRTGTIVGTKHKWRSLVAGASAAAALLLGLAGPGNGTPVAQAADTGVLSSASLKVTADGEFAVGDTSWRDAAGPGKDTGTSEKNALQNSVVRSNDYITYSVNTNVSTKGDVTFIFKAPTGLVWDASVTQNCKTGGASFSDNGQTFTCVKTVDANNVVFSVKAQVIGLGNGAIVPTVTMQAGSLPETAATVPYSSSGQITVSAMGKANVLVAQNNQLNPTANSENEPGLAAGFKVYLFVPVDPNSGTKGVEPLASSFTYQIKLPTLAGAEITTCQYPTMFRSKGTGANYLTNAGTYVCAIDEDDSTILNVTVTGADSTVSRWPTTTNDNVAVAPGYAVFSSVSIQIWYPAEDFTEATTVYYQVVNFDPPTVSRQSNYGSNDETSGSGYAPNQEPGAKCVFNSTSYVMVELAGYVTDPTNCHRAMATVSYAKPSVKVWEYTSDGGLLPDAPDAWNGTNLVAPGAKYRIEVVGDVASNLFNPVLSDASGCLTWDNRLQQLDSTRQMTSTASDSGAALDPLKVTIEYASIQFANDDERRSFNCGLAGSGDATQWSTTYPTAQEDADAVTAIRWTWTDPVNPVTVVPALSVPMRRTTILTADFPTDNVTRVVYATNASEPVIPVFLTTQYTAVSMPEKQSIFNWAASTYDPTKTSEFSGSNPASQGNRVLANDTEIQVALAWDDVENVNGTNKPGTTHTITVTPTIVPESSSAQNVTITVQLPNACVTYQGFSAVQQGNPEFTVLGDVPIPNCDGTNPGPGQILTFNLGNLSQQNQTVNAGGPITFNVTINAAYQYSLPGDLVATATSTTVSDLRTATSCNIPANGNTCTAVRTGQGSLSIAYDATFSVMKTASAAVVLSGSQYSYQVAWTNHLPEEESAGTGLFIDVLPFVGDDRGTTSLGALRVDDVEIDSTSSHNNPGDIIIEYTCQDAATVLAAVTDDSNPSLSTPAEWWSTSKDCQSGATYVTAVRFTTTVELENNTTDIINMQVTPIALQVNGVIVNSMYGKTSEMDEPLENMAQNEVVSGVGSLSGNVFTDLNYNWINDDVTSAASLPPGTTVAIVGGYTFGPNMNDDTANNGEGGDDIALDAPAALQQAITDGLVPGPVTVNPDGTYSFPAVNPGNYQLQVNLPAGYEVAVLPDISSNDPKTSQPTTDGPALAQPANDIAVGSGEDVTDVNFGIQKTLAVTLTDKSVSGKANNDVTGNVFVPADDLISDNALTGDEFTGADEIWQPPAATITASATSHLGIAITFDPASGDYTYTPQADTIGDPVDSFTYTVTDVQGHTATATVNITLTADAPQLTPLRSGEQTVLLSYLQGDEENGTAPGVVTFANTVTVDTDAKAAPSCQVVSVSPDTAQAGIDNDATVTFTATDDTAVGTYTITVQCADSFGRSTGQVTDIVHVVSPELTIEPSPGGVLADGATGAVGDTIIWTYKVTNTGTADLTSITLTDLFTRPPVTAPGISALDEPLNGEPAITCDGMANGTISLAHGESIECIGTSTVTQADIDAGQALNAESVTGEAVTDLATGIAQAGPAPAQVPLDQNAAVTVEKIAEVTDVNYSGQIDLGDQITFKITVTNTGNVTLRSVLVTDSMEGLTLDCGDQANGQITLTPDAPGNVIVCTTSVYTITADDVAAGEVVNVATAGGQYGPLTRTPGGPGGDFSKSSVPSEVTVTVTAPQAPTGGQLASGSWLWLGGIAPLLVGAILLLRRRQSQAGEAV